MFHDHITELSYDFFGGVKNSTIAYMDWAQESVEYFMNHVIPDIDIVIREDRIVPCAQVGIAVLAFGLGMLCGVSEALTVGAATGIVLGGLGLELSALLEN